MRRALGIFLVLALVTLAFGGVFSGGGDDGYKVRAIFDSADFVVKGEEVQIAGAKVGQVDSVDLTMPGQKTSVDGSAEAGKAAVVISIDDPGFQDFRSDASCLIRPQSLIGEKFIDCTPTQARAPGRPVPPELPEIPAGEAGAGEHLLPLEQNGKTVDLDLIQNIMRRPYADRFRLILNELGAGVAARGPDLAAIVDRADPALRQTDRVLAILAQQNQDLASLAQNSDTVLSPLARERSHITGFFGGANDVNTAVLERQPQFEQGLRQLPAALHEVRGTMKSLRGLTDQGTPLFTDLNRSATSFSKVTQKLGPLAEAGIPALETLGDAAQTAGPKLVAADPVVVQTAALGNAQKPVAENLSSLLDTFSRTNGFKYLTDFIYNTVGSTNGYDQFGHFLRANLQVTACLDYQVIVQSGCESYFQPASPTTAKKCAQKDKKKRKACQEKQKQKKAKSSSVSRVDPQLSDGSSGGSSGSGGIAALDFLLGQSGEGGP
jgi:phospholipid/cholesterol/gamma-HCH transport system substrate-binding protein